jgi:uncharacterized protein (TIRG00374 family)
VSGGGNGGIAARKLEVEARAARGPAKQWLGLLLRVTLAGACFAVLYRVAHLDAAVRISLRADPLLIALAVAVLLLRVPLMAWRWQIILVDMGVAAVWAGLARMLLVSTFLGMALPSANGSDLVRGVMLKRARVPLGAAIVSILVDRLYGLFSLGLLGLVGSLALLSAHGSSHLVQAAAILSAAIVAAVGGLALLARRAHAWLAGRRPNADAWTGRLLATACLYTHLRAHET